MRGLPPPPADFLSVEAVWTVSDESACSTSWWLFAPGADAADWSQLNTLLGAFFLGPIADLLPLLGTDVTCGVLRLATYGMSPQEVSFVPAANVGGTGTTNPLNSALVLTWRTTGLERPVVGHTFLPLSDSLPSSTHRSLTGLTYSQAQAGAEQFRQSVNSLTSPDGALCVLNVLSRVTNKQPRDHTLSFPVVQGDASPWIGTLRRRIRPRSAAPLSI